MPIYATKLNTDIYPVGSRILGLGDLGVNGMPISIGKLSLYVAAAGYVPHFHPLNLPSYSIGYSVRPQSTIPICLDLGTNNKQLLEDPLYLGLRQPRASPEETEEFMDEFMHEMHKAFPRLLVQFEDFATEKAFKFLDRYRARASTSPVFNDDIQVRECFHSVHVRGVHIDGLQGTGAMVLSGFMNAARLSSAASGRPLEDQRILFVGAGSAGVGVATQLKTFFKMQGMTDEEASERIYLVDSQGLVFDARGSMAEHKKRELHKVGKALCMLMEAISSILP